MEKDVVIIGGSFAGLATAHFIENGKGLILERQNVLGKTQRSTCCTTLNWMKKLGTEKSVLKTFDYLKIHSSDGNCSDFKLPEKFCTIDYKIFCETLAGGLINFEVLTDQKVTELVTRSSNIVKTAKGGHKGRILVDCSGWPGIRLNNSQTCSNKGLAFGIEIETEFQGDVDSFHIYYGKRFIKEGYGWIFPTSNHRARVGLGGFSIDKPHAALDCFLKEIGIKRDSSKAHGGYLPLMGMGNPVNAGVFVVGDACNQVLPATGEGIRKAFEYAELCAGVINRILKEEISLEKGLRIYGEEVLKAKKFYENMVFLQTLAIHCPEWARNRIIKTLSNTDEFRKKMLLERYLNDNITTPKSRILKTLLGWIKGIN